MMYLHQYLYAWLSTIFLMQSCLSLVTSDVNSASRSYIRCAARKDAIDNESPCSGNMIQWPLKEGMSKRSSNDSLGGRANLDIQAREEAEKELYDYLYSNLMPFDIPNKESLGFHSTHEDLPDGLNQGIVGPTISMSLDAKRYHWTNHVPKSIYFEYVGSFASTNESRSNWRELFHVILRDLVEPLLDISEVDSNQSTASVEEVIQMINKNIWDIFSNSRTNKPIYFKSGQTPLIYDPMSILVYGYASCTGLSIFLVDLLRTVGIPARIAGTPAWNGRQENGNHSWVEFYGSDSKWHIMESLPASGGKNDMDLWDPCQWWFCNKERVTDTSFYAARLARDGDGTTFPMAWDLQNDGVMGEKRTDFMRDLCSQC